MYHEAGLLLQMSRYLKHVVVVHSPSVPKAGPCAEGRDFNSIKREPNLEGQIRRALIISKGIG